MAKPTPPANATVTTVQVGTYNPLSENANSDGFTLAADLNDTTATWIIPGTLKVSAPDKTYVESGNIRSPGVAVVRWQYKARTISLSISIRGASYAAIRSTLTTIIAAIENPPYTLRIAYPGASQYSYFDVTKCTHNIPSDPILWLNKALPHYEIHFEGMPGFRGDRVTLSNLAVNPGFEAPAGGGTAQTMPTAFSDTFANVNAYAVKVGSAPSVAASVMTIPNGARVAFGSPAWGAYQTWQARFQFLTGQTSDWYLHFTDANNFLDCFAGSTSITLRHAVTGTQHTLATGTISLTNSNFYWIKITQYPTVSGNPPMVEVQLFNDSAGAVGTAVAGSHLGPVATFDAVTALVGQPQISVGGANLPIGGAFSNVHTVSLFGPGAWTFGGVLGSATGAASGAWDGTRGELGMSGNATAGTQTYPNGPVTSFGAGRIDAAPAGTLDAQWNLYSGGAAAGTQAMPIATAGDVVYARAQVKSSGLGNGATVKLNYTEYNSSGTSLRTGTLQTLTISGGVQLAWPASGSFSLAGNWTTGANCAYVDIQVRVTDTTAGSANGTVWIDNAQVWDSTNTANGETNMPYCELRFPNSPAQLMVSGLLGNMPAPAQVALGTYVAGWANQTLLTSWLGMRKAENVKAAAQLTAVIPNTQSIYTPILDTSAYGGCYWQINTSGAGGAAFPYLTVSDQRGAYHFFGRYYTPDSTLTNTTTNILEQVSNSNVTVEYIGSSAQPVPSANAWNAIDFGQLNVPGSSLPALADPSTMTALMYVYFTEVGNQTQRHNWAALLPVDASLVELQLFNNHGGTVTNTYFFLHADGLASQLGGTTGMGLTTPANALPSASSAVGSPSHGSGGFSNSYALTASADPWLTLDPNQGGGSMAGIAQGLSIFFDAAGSVLPFYGEIQYTPLFVWPR